MKKQLIPRRKRSILSEFTPLGLSFYQDGGMFPMSPSQRQQEDLRYRGETGKPSIWTNKQGVGVPEVEQNYVHIQNGSRGIRSIIAGKKMTYNNLYGNNTRHSQDIEVGPNHPNFMAIVDYLESIGANPQGMSQLTDAQYAKLKSIASGGKFKQDR
jgi:hypothetical protein